MEKSAYTYGDLPHLNARLVFVTFRLADSLPVNALDEMKRFDMEWQTKYCNEWTNGKEEEYLRQRKILENDLLDKALGSCILNRCDVRKIVVKALMHFNDERYWLHAFVVMPNHVHMLMEMIDPYRLQDVMHSIKSYTAHQINEICQSSGPVWEREYFDKIVRDSRHYQKVMRYIENNPKHCRRGEFALYLS